MHGERQVERRFVFGLLWPHISPLQMNINKELLISAACAVRAYVCMRGRRRGVPCEQAFLHLLALLLLLLLLFHTTTCICGTSFLPASSSSSSCEEEVSLSSSPHPHPSFCSASSSRCVPRLSPFPAIQRFDSDAGTGSIMIKYSAAYFFGSRSVNFTHRKYVRKKTKYAQGNVVS